MASLMSYRTAFRHLRVIAAVSILAILFGLFVLGAQPFAAGLFPSPWDKLVHACVFGALAVVLGTASGLSGRRMLAVAVAGALLVGGLDEWHQVYLPGRQAGLDDWIADGIGSVFGALVLSCREHWPASED